MKIDVEVTLNIEFISKSSIDISIHGKLHSQSMPLEGDQIFYPYGEDEPTSLYDQYNEGIGLTVIQAAYGTGPRPGKVFPLLILGQTHAGDPDGDSIPIKDMDDLQYILKGLLMLLEDPYILWGLEGIADQPLRDAIEHIPEEVRCNLKPTTW